MSNPEPVTASESFDASKFFFADPDSESGDNHFAEIIDCKYYLPSEVAKLDLDASQLSMFHLNCCSLPNKIAEIQSTIGSLNVKFTFISFTETWLNANNVELYSNCFPGYSHYHFCREHKKGGSISIYVDNSVSVMDQILAETVNFEHLTLKLSIGSSNTVVSTIYRPPNTSLADFNNEFSSFVTNLQTNNKTDIVLIGDFNVNLLQYNDNNVRTFLNTAYSNNLCPLITLPSRLGMKSATLIDNIFTSFAASRSGLLYSNISDHFPIFATLNVRANLAREYSVCRPLSQGKINALLQDLSKINWETILLDDANVDTTYDIFRVKLLSLINYHMPIVRKSHKRHFKQPWMSEALSNSCNKKNRLYKNFIKGLISKDEYITYKNHLSILIKARKKQYHNEFILTHKLNASKIWDHINNLVGRQKNHTINTLDPHELNSFFANLGYDTTKHIPNTTEYTNFKYKSQSNSMLLHPVTSNDILNIVNSFKNNSSYDADYLSMSLIKQIISGLVKPLTTIINASLLSGIVPRLLKTARVVPIFKAGSKTELINYRPISILPVISKILEKVMLNQLTNFISSFNILTNDQHGFRAGHNVTTATFSSLNYITDLLDKKMHVVGIYLDVSKAFDSINHNILLFKLQQYGIRGHVLDWFNSYLSSRYQYVNLHDSPSCLLPNNLGVPQGSLLGPILFSLFINDLPLNFPKVKFTIYADDTSIYICSNNLHDLEVACNNAMKGIAYWFLHNKLCLNFKKTCYVLFRVSHNAPVNQFNICIADVTLERRESVKFLGLYIDDVINWKVHIAYLCSKLAKDIAMLRVAARCLPTTCIIMLFHAFFSAHLTFGIEFWSSAGTTSLAPIHVLHKKALRIAAGNSMLSHAQLSANALQVLMFDDLCLYHCCIFMFKIYHNCFPASITASFPKSPILRTTITRTLSYNFYIVYVRINVRKGFIVHNGSMIWNGLPTDLKQHNGTLFQFKAKLFAYISDRATH